MNHVEIKRIFVRLAATNFSTMKVAICTAALVAQWIRRRSPKPKIGGSSPPEGNHLLLLFFVFEPKYESLNYSGQIFLI